MSQLIADEVEAADVAEMNERYDMAEAEYMAEVDVLRASVEYKTRLQELQAIHGNDAHGRSLSLVLVEQEFVGNTDWHLSCLYDDVASDFL